MEITEESEKDSNIEQQQNLASNLIKAKYGGLNKANSGPMMLVATILTEIGIKFYRSFLSTESASTCQKKCSVI